MAKFDSVRNEIMEMVSKVLIDNGYEVLVTGSQERCIPIVNEEKDEGYLVLTFKVPKGSRDGDAYDGYEVAEDYKLKVETKAAKAKEAAAEKAEKIERDKRAREQKRLLKEAKEGK